MYIRNARVVHTTRRATSTLYEGTFVLSYNVHLALQLHDELNDMIQQYNTNTSVFYRTVRVRVVVLHVRKF